jgi:hypothetical protein
VIKGVPLVHRGEVWLVSSQLKARLLRERSSYKSAIFAPILELFCRHAVLKPLALTVVKFTPCFVLLDVQLYAVFIQHMLRSTVYLQHLALTFLQRHCGPGCRPLALLPQVTHLAEFNFFTSHLYFWQS